MSKKVWLSIDWDFFQEERTEWDWGHAETSIFQQLAWVSRAFFLGKDIKDITHPDRHEPKASEFWTRAFQNWDFSNCDAVFVADSHAQALPFFYSLQRIAGVADEVWNFDAHHDLGYVPLYTLTKWAKEGKAEAGSWAYILLSKLKKLKYLHFYPTWKDHSIEPRGWSKNESILERVSQLGADKAPWDERIEVTALFIAKSTGWSPPWNDGEFKKFVQQAEKLSGLTFTDEENVTTLRGWDDEGSKQMNEAFLKMRETNSFLQSLEKEKQHGQPESKESDELPPS